MSDGTTSRSRKNSVNSLAISANEFYTDQTTDVHTAALMDDCSSVIAKFHYTDPTGPARTRTDFFCGETPLGPCGSGRARVVEFSF